MATGSAPRARVLLVTGAARGIGRRVAELGSQAGWAVAVNYRVNADCAQAVVDGLRSRGARAEALQADVTQPGDVVRLFDETERRLGGVTDVVNNAGVVAPLTHLAEATTERLRHIVEVNVLGALLVAREAARRLSTARGGSGGAIVNVSSIASRLGSPGEYVDYAASKGAVDSLTLGLARELGPEGVRVNAVRPGLIDTEIHAESGAPDRAFRLGRHTPLGRAGTAEEVAQAILWLLSPESSYVTGALLDVGGGR